MSIILNNITPRQKLIIAKGLCDYQYIMNNLQESNEDFEAVYYDFYLKARWAIMSNKNNRKIYFDKLKAISPTSDLMDIICDLQKNMSRNTFEFSICTKLLHTKNPSLPIYDSKVREYLSKSEKVEFWWARSKEMYGKPALPKTSDYDKIKHDWDKLCEWYKQFLASEKGMEWIEWFDNNFPAHKNISDVKKIDFIIFATT